MSEQFRRLQKQVAAQQKVKTPLVRSESSIDQYRSSQFNNLQRQVAAQQAALVDENYLQSYLSDSQQYVAQTEADSKALNWATATSQQESDRRNEAHQAMWDKTGRVMAWFSANKSKLPGDTYQQYMQYLDTFSDFQTQSAAAFEKSMQAYTQFETEEDYNKAVAQGQWQIKYEGMSYEQINKAIATLPDGDEKMWLETYQPAMTEADYEYEIANTGWIIDRLEAEQEEYRELTRWEQDAVGREREAAFRSKYGSVTDLEALIGNKKAYLNRLKYEQEGMKLASVTKNEDFDSYKGYVNAILADACEDENASVSQFCDDMLPDEIAIYCYHYSKNGTDVAERYLHTIRETINQRRGREIYQPMEGKTLQELAFSLRAGLDQFGTGISSLFNSEDDYIPRSEIQFAGDLAREGLSDIDLKWYNFKEGQWEDAKIFGNSLGQVLYDTGSTVANMAPSVLASNALKLVNPILGQAAGALLMGSSAAGNAYQEKLNLGYDMTTARAYGVMVGASEVVLEKVLGGISKLGGGTLTNAAIKKLDKVDNVLTRFAKSAGGKLLMNSGSEALEEGLQSILEPYLWEAVSGEEANVNWEETLYSSLMGFITGGLFEGVDMAIDTAAKVTNRIITKADIGNMEALINPIHEVTGVSAEQLQNPLPSQNDPVNPNITTENVGQQSETDQAMKDQANVPVNPEAVAQSLMNKGFNPETSAEIADAVAARLNGQELTKAQRNILSSATNSPSVQSVISDMQKVQKGSQKLLAGNSGKSTETVQPINNQADVAQSLRNKGINSKKADGIAEAITASLNGQELTRPQRNILRSALGSPTVQSVVSEFMKKKTDGIDSTQNRVYDNSNIRDIFTSEEKTALGNLSDQSVGAFSNHAYATATEDSAIDQSKGASSKGVFDGGLDASIKNIDYFIEGTKSFDEVLDDYAKVYADKINSNQLWSWEDTIPGGENLTRAQKSIIKQQAVDAGLIPDIRVTQVEGMRYGFADFESAEVVIKTLYLPEHMWKMGDAEQFKWLNEQNGGSVEGYTWHHTETPGEMQLVPTGIHNITTHNGGRTAGMWADSPR